MRTDALYSPHPRFIRKMYENDLPSGGQREMHCRFLSSVSPLRIGSGKKGKEEAVGGEKKGAHRGLLGPMLLA